MQIVDSRHKIITLIRLLMDDSVMIGEDCGPIGSFTLSGGSRNGKKKYQSLKGEFAIPHDAIKPELKDNCNIIKESLTFPFMRIPEKYVSDIIKEHNTTAKKHMDKELKKHPKINKALNDLIAAIREELKCDE